MRVMLNTGKAYAGKKEYNSALDFTRKLLLLAKETGAKRFIRDGTGVMWNIYDQLQIADSAYKYYRQYAAMKDSLINVRYIRQLALFKQQSGNEKEQLHLQLTLQKESVRKKIAISILFIVILLAFIIIRVIILKRKNEKNHLENALKLQQLESEKSKSKLLQQATELEMQALRAQMNPHFIFNCLSSINHFVLKNETEIASDHLTKFSRLIRMVLNYSQKKLISLEDELEMLQLYLEMEKLRFKNTFDYNIIYYNDIDAGAIFIPPLIFQPFAENAIWHGIMHNESPGRLDIALSSEKNILNCTITDNGIGRKKASELKGKTEEKQKSMGMQITKQRLALLNHDLNDDKFYAVDDLVDENGNALGTRVTLKIRYKELGEEAE